MTCTTRPKTRRRTSATSSASEFRAWKHSDLPRFQQTIRKIIAYDLDWIEHRSDYIVAYWDEYASKGAGSQAELSLAHRRGIPVYLVTELPLGNVSGWILGCASEVFSSFDELKQFLTARYPRTDKNAASQRDQTPAEIGMNWAKGNLGWIEVVCGPMFSGKSEELIRRLRRAEIARQRVQIFKPGIDDRYSADHIVSHSDLKIRSVAVRDSADIEAQLDLRTEVIGIDEAQFLGMELSGLRGAPRRHGQAHHHRRPRHRLPRDARSIPFRSCWRWPTRSPRRWPSACSAAIRPSTRSAWSPAKT